MENDKNIEIRHLCKIPIKYPLAIRGMCAFRDRLYIVFDNGDLYEIEIVEP